MRAAVRGLARPHRAAAAAGFAVLVAATAIGLLTAPVLGHVIDLVHRGRPASAITAPVTWLVAIALAQGVLTALGVSLIARLGEGMLAALRERFVARALHLPLERVERAGSGDLTSRVTDDVSVITSAVREAMPALARSLLTIGLTLAGMAVLDWRFMLVALLAVPIQLHTVRWYTRRAGPLYAAQRVAVGEQQQRLLGAVGGAATVRAFRLTGEHVGLVETRSQAAVDLALRGVRLVTRFYSRLNLAEFIGLSAVLATGFLLVRSGDASIGTASAAALYFHGLFTPINIVLGLADDVQAATAGLARLVGVAGAEDRAPRAASPA
ncbi:ABC transporter transmembrane domain-containing protein, partial [Planomonospora algeriensis]